MRLTEDMQRVVREQALGFVATVRADGTPAVSPKGTTSVWDEEHLVFLHIHSDGTVANLAMNPAVEVNVVDPIRRKGYRFAGHADTVFGGARFEEIVKRFERDRSTDRRVVKAAVLIAVRAAHELISPAYDDGSTEEDVARRFFGRHHRLFESTFLVESDSERVTFRGGYEISIARISQVEDVVAVWARAYEHTPSHETDDCDAVRTLITAADGCLLVAEHDGRVIGSVIAAWDGWRANLYRLAVAPEHRRQGVARHLIAAGEARLRARGARRSSALVARDDAAAVALWTGAGYRDEPLTGRFVHELR